MTEHQNNTTVYSLFDNDGNLLPEDQREEITSSCVFFPETLALEKTTIGKDAPLKITKYGNAKVSMFKTITHAATPQETERAEKYLNKQCDLFIAQQIEGYKKYLGSLGIDFQKVETAFEGRR